MARMTSEERWHRIATAAATVIVRDGLDAATTRAIAEEAGVPLGLLHYAFEDKQALFAAVYEHWMASVFTIDVEAGVGVHAAARALADATLVAIESDLNLAAAQYELLLWARRAAPTLAAEIYRRWADTWRATLRRAAEPGTSKAELEELLDHLLVSVDGIVVRLLATGDLADARRLMDRAVPPARARTKSVRSGPRLAGK